MWGTVQFVSIMTMTSMTLSSPVPVAEPVEIALYGYRYTPVNSDDARLARMATMAPRQPRVTTSDQLQLSQRITPPAVVIYGHGRSHHHGHDVSICGDVVTNVRS